VPPPHYEEFSSQLSYTKNSLFKIIPFFSFSFFLRFF